MDTEATPTEPTSPPASFDPHGLNGIGIGIDLDGIERDLADVEVALARLDAGTYWTDEVTGNELSAELLAEHPTARRGGE
jgi:hypothetical protein